MLMLRSDKHAISKQQTRHSMRGAELPIMYQPCYPTSHPVGQALKRACTIFLIRKNEDCNKHQGHINKAPSKPTRLHACVCNRPNCKRMPCCSGHKNAPSCTEGAGAAGFSTALTYTLSVHNFDSRKMMLIWAVSVWSFFGGFGHFQDANILHFTMHQGKSCNMVQAHMTPMTACLIGVSSRSNPP